MHPAIKKWSSTLGKIAAALVIVMAIVTPVAVATVEPVRVKLMELLIDIQSEYIRLSMTDTNSETIHIPEEWSGDYFPTYIPDDMELHSTNDRVAYLLLSNTNKETVELLEYTDVQTTQIDTENALISYGDIHGYIAIIAEKEESLIVAWTNGHKYFIVTSTISKDETLRIANSLRLINNFLK